MECRMDRGGERERATKDEPQCTHALSDLLSLRLSHDLLFLSMIVVRKW
jgi:hypothetical protein